MYRTFIQITALSFILMSSFFLIKGVVSLSVQNMIKLSQTPFGGTYMRMVKNLIQQKSDTIVGFVLLLASFALSLINFLWPMRIGDFDVSYRGFMIAIVVSIVIFFSARRVSTFLLRKWYTQAENIVKKPKDE